MSIPTERTVTTEERFKASVRCDACRRRKATLEFRGPEERLLVAVCDDAQCRELVADYFRFYAEHVTTLVDSARTARRGECLADRAGFRSGGLAPRKPNRRCLVCQDATVQTRKG